MVDTTVAEPSPPPAHRAAGRSIGDRIRFVLRGIGQTLITAGLVVLLFVVYEVWITNLFAEREQSHVANAYRKEIIAGKDPLLSLPGSKDPTIPLGTGIANLYIPRLGKDFHFNIVQGSKIPTDSQLEKGPAHYRDTALPGQTGNFAMAGHRVGKGEPFLNLDQLRAGDSVIVETGSYWYVYRVKGQDHGLSKPDDVDGVAGREIVSMNDGRVLLPVPDHPDSTVKEALLTMTTCHPKFTAAKRMVIHAVLTAKVAVDCHVGCCGADHAGVHQGPLLAGEQLMYVWIWRHLPGPVAAKLGQTLALLLVVTALLLFVIFPWIEPHLPINQVTVPNK